jgi:hypothetical protein
MVTFEADERKSEAADEGPLDSGSASPVVATTDEDEDLEEVLPSPRAACRAVAERYRERRGWALKVLAVRGNPDKIGRADHLSAKEVPHFNLADQRRWADFQARAQRVKAGGAPSSPDSNRSPGKNANARQKTQSRKESERGSASKLQKVGSRALSVLKTPTASPTNAMSK